MPTQRYCSEALVPVYNRQRSRLFQTESDRENGGAVQDVPRGSADERFNFWQVPIDTAR